MHETAIRIAPLLPRGLAFLLDNLILLVLRITVSSMIGDIAITRTETYAILVILTAGYHIGFLAATSTTPGKAALGLYVGDSQGGRIRPDSAILRYLMLFITQLATIDSLLFWALTAFILANAVMIVVDKKRRALHDRLAKTLVLVGRPSAINNEYDPVTGKRRL